MTVAVIGGGMIGQKHIENLKADGRAEVRWICSEFEEDIQRIRQKFNVPHGTSDLREVLQDEKVDSVIIATPPFLHAEQAVAAIEAGKHVFIEKPLCTTAEDADKIVSSADSHPRQLVLPASCRHSRLQPRFGFIRQLLDEGVIGEVYYIRHSVLRACRRYGIEYNPAAGWARNRASAGGGPLLDWGVYDLSFHLGLFHDRLSPVDVRHFTVNGIDAAREQYPNFDVEEHGAAFMQFDSGLAYYYERSSNAHIEKPNETILYGSNGALSFDYHSWGDPAILLSKAEPRNPDKTVLEVLQAPDSGAPHDDHFAVIQHFVDCVAEGKPPAITPQIEKRHLDILFSIITPPPRYLRP